MQILAQVGESDIDQIKQGQPVKFTVQALPGQTFTGTVQQVRLQSTTADNIANYTVVVTLENPEGKLLPGKEFQGQATQPGNVSPDLCMLGMQGLQSELLLELVKIAVGMQEDMIIEDTKSCDEAIHSLPDRFPSGPQGSIVLCRCHGQFDAACGKDLQRQQTSTHFGKFPILDNTLQHLTKDQVQDAQALDVDFSMNPIRLRSGNASQIIHPHAGVDDYHGR
jgi:hypothetical protein